MKLSANLGFLWSDLALPDAIRAAAGAGFDAVECHWPYDVEAAAVRDALNETGLPMLGLNTRRGDVQSGDNGVAAIPGRETEAREYIDEALAYADTVGCLRVHVMAGRTDRDATAERCFRDNLRYASEQAEATGKTILIEPLNVRDAPGYHLSTVDEALQTLEAVGADNLKIMFDCYHIQIMQGDLIRRIQSSLPHIGHIQFAGVPDRAEPDDGEVNYRYLLNAVAGLGWDRPFGAEYRPRTTTDAGLAWMAALK